MNFDHALRTLERAAYAILPGSRTPVKVPRSVIDTAIQALKTVRAVQIACNACDGATRLRLWASIERELMADAARTPGELPQNNRPSA